MKIMIFGGSFDPPHLGHQTMAEEVLKKKLADEVWLVPCYRHPFEKNVGPAERRLAMLSLLAAKKIKICDYEINKDGISFTVDTLGYLSRKYPENKFSLLIGSDQLPSFDRWKDYQKILKDYQVFVYPREGYPVEKTYSGMTVLKDVRIVPVSSTEVRFKVAHGEEINSLVCQKVEEYINSHLIYQE